MTAPTITEFIAARLDEDEQIARNAGMPPTVGGDRETWVYDRDAFAVRATHGRWNVATRRDDPADSREIHMTDSYGEHIARFDPARVLREVEAKRAIIKRHRPSDDYESQLCTACQWDVDCDAPRHDLDEEDAPCPDLRHLAAAYADDPDWREEWRP
ncbi:DUF6221 family protein [Glycomyces arizonensis]|uniref:DUF6221 family protein n=1 Tax=Glycomyces arizonensis TaxID=256035 RepID=UPI0004273CB9|nr:DUF6221 family protein [Glycomyces arizonensis]